jgi:Carboxypeptidase regulatory-like domain
VRLRGVLLSCLVVILVGVNQLRGQVTSGSVWGYVNDSSGRRLPGAEVNVTDAAHAVTRKVSTDGTGLYRVVGLPPAMYAVDAAADRFEKVEFPDLIIPVSGRVQLDFHLPLAGRKESIQVAAQEQPVSAESSELGLILDRKRIESLLYAAKPARQVQFAGRFTF